MVHSEVFLVPTAQEPACVDLNIKLHNAEVVVHTHVHTPHPDAQATRRLCANRTAPFAMLLRTTSTPVQHMLSIHATQQLNKTAFVHMRLLWPAFGQLHPLHIRMHDGHEISTEKAPPFTCHPPAPPVETAENPQHTPWMLLAAAAVAGTVTGAALAYGSRQACALGATTPTNTRQVRRVAANNRLSTTRAQRVAFLSHASSTKRNLSSALRAAWSTAPTPSSPPLTLGLLTVSVPRQDMRRKSMWDLEGRLVRLIEE